MLFAALLRCTSYNGNAIFSGNQSISFAQDSTVRAEYLVRAGLDGSRRVSRSRRTRRFAQDSTVRAGLDGSRRTRRFAQDSTVRAGLDGSRRQNSTVRAGLDGSRRTRPFWPLRRLIKDGPHINENGWTFDKPIGWFLVHMPSRAFGFAQN